MNNDSLKILSRHYGCQCWLQLCPSSRKTPVNCWPNVECIISIQRWLRQKVLLEFSDSISHCLTRADAIGAHPHFQSCQRNLHLPKTTPQTPHGTQQTMNSRELMSHRAVVTQRSTFPLWKSEPLYITMHGLYALPIKAEEWAPLMGEGKGRCYLRMHFSVVPFFFFNFSIILTTFSRVTFWTIHLNLNLCCSDCF